MKNVFKISKKHRESIKDIIHNNYLYVVNFIQVRVFKKKDKSIDLTSWTLSFQDKFESFNVDVWRVGHAWGVIHPELSYQYYGTESVGIDERGLVLEQKYYPRENITDWYNTDIFFNPKWSVGLITSKSSYGYGLYDFYVTLPKGAGLWPAIWFVSDKTYPPEIDLFEGYSDINGLYKSHLNTNLHFNFKPTQKESVARGSFVKDVDSKNEVVRFTMIWDEKYIKMYYNGFLVRCITDEKTLVWFRDNNMIIILNNAIRNDYYDRVSHEQESEFVIHEVSYYKKSI